MLTTSRPLSQLMSLVLLVAALAGCGAAQLRPAAPSAALVAEQVAAGRAADAAAMLAATPDDLPAMRAALDLVLLAMPLAPADSALRDELDATQRSLLALLAVGDARAALAQADAPPTELTADARALADQALAVEQVPPMQPPAVAQAPRATQAPARPTAPAAPSYAVAQRKSFEGSGASGQFASCIDVQILAPTGPVSGAVIGINNGDHSFENQTDANGYTGRCGLGASTWSVVLFWTPEGGAAKTVSTTVYLNGAPEQRAAVVFQGQ